MTWQSKKTFDQILRSVGLQNARILEEKAQTAISLARTYPKSARSFQAIECRLIEQLLKIIPELKSCQEVVDVPSHEIANEEIGAATTARP